MKFNKFIINLINHWIKKIQFINLHKTIKNIYLKIDYIAHGLTVSSDVDTTCGGGDTGADCGISNISENNGVKCKDGGFSSLHQDKSFACSTASIRASIVNLFNAWSRPLAGLRLTWKNKRINIPYTYLCVYCMNNHHGIDKSHRGHPSRIRTIHITKCGLEEDSL